MRRRQAATDADVDVAEHRQAARAMMEALRVDAIPKAGWDKTIPPKGRSRADDTGALWNGHGGYAVVGHGNPGSMEEARGEEIVAIGPLAFIQDNSK